ncbi:MAG: hypothetical protein V8R81_02010 [Clostridia bacterium]
MKKLLILVLIALLLTLSIFIVIQGVHIGSLEILGVKGIQEKSSQLDEKIQQAGKLAEKDYQQALNDVKTNTKKLQEEKKNYEDMTQISEDGDVQAANQIEKYEIETLWVKLGNHATTQGVVIKMDVKKGNAQDVYDLQFTATGSYISITDFISAIENDSSLGFKIEEFKLVPSSSGSDLQATFVCKDITIKDVSQSAVTTTTDSNIQTDGTANGTNQNNTNSTDTNSATNTTNGTANNTNTTNSTNATSTNTAR